jgi:hypothetical protein
VFDCYERAEEGHGCGQKKRRQRAINLLKCIAISLEPI